MNASHARAERQPARPAPGGRVTTPRAEAATADIGNLAMQSLLRAGAIQAKLTIGRPDDPLEAEADKVADHVMRKPANGGGAGSCTCAAGGEVCEDCQKNQTGAPPMVRRAAESGASSSGASSAPSIVSQTLGGSGRALEASTRADMEGRFGRDFGDVRIHTDQNAAKSAAAINALAYTAGSHIAFGQGRYAPQTDAGQRLLAHELAHVVQQTGYRDAAGNEPQPVRIHGVDRVVSRKGCEEMGQCPPNAVPIKVFSTLWQNAEKCLQDDYKELSKHTVGFNKDWVGVTGSTKENLIIDCLRPHFTAKGYVPDVVRARKGKTKKAGSRCRRNGKAQGNAKQNPTFSTSQI